MKNDKPELDPKAAELLAKMSQSYTNVSPPNPHSITANQMMAGLASLLKLIHTPKVEVIYVSKNTIKIILDHVEDPDVSEAIKLAKSLNPKLFDEELVIKEPGTRAFVVSGKNLAIQFKLAYEGETE